MYILCIFGYFPICLWLSFFLFASNWSTYFVQHTFHKWEKFGNKGVFPITLYLNCSGWNKECNLIMKARAVTNFYTDGVCCFCVITILRFGLLYQFRSIVLHNFSFSTIKKENKLMGTHALDLFGKPPFPLALHKDEGWFPHKPLVWL